MSSRCARQPRISSQFSYCQSGIARMMICFQILPKFADLKTSRSSILNEFKQIEICLDLNTLEQQKDNRQMKSWSPVY